MAIVINGSGTVTGISVGGLPDGIVDAGTLATNSVDSAELIDGAIDTAHIATDQITSAILPTGSVLQVINGNTSTAVTSTATGTWVDTGITATITPSSTSSKIIVQINICGLWRNSGEIWNRAALQFLRGVTVIGVTAYAQGWDRTTSENREAGAMYSIYDSPSTTSATTYKVQFQSEALSSTTGIAVQKDGNSGQSNIFLYEIAG